MPEQLYTRDGKIYIPATDTQIISAVNSIYGSRASKPGKITAAIRTQIQRYRQSGWTVTRIASQLSLSRPTVTKVLKQQRQQL